MAKAKSGAKKSPPKVQEKKSVSKNVGLLKSASERVARVAAKLVKTAAEQLKGTPPKKGKSAPSVAPAAKAAASSAKAALPVASKVPPPAAVAAGKAPKGKIAKTATSSRGKLDVSIAPAIKAPEAQRPRATKLPAVGQAINKRELEQVLTVGQGRGVGGEGSLKGRLVVKDGLPTLLVVGRDKRELGFVLQGPDQEVLPAYVDHKVSVSGLIRKTGNYGGTVDVRKYTAKRPDQEVPVETVQESKLRYLSPGEVAQVSSAGMGAGMHGFAAVRGYLEMSGDDYLIVVSNGGTRQQVSFVLSGKNLRSLRKHVGHLVQATGVVDKASGWGGTLDVEMFELRPAEFKTVSRQSIELTHVEGDGDEVTAEVKLNHGLTVRLPETAGFTWAIEPTVAKRVGLREANLEMSGGTPSTREFFFTPRNPGNFDVEFFLAKVFAPAQVSRSYKLNVTVKP